MDQEKLAEQERERAVLEAEQAKRRAEIDAAFSSGASGLPSLGDASNKREALKLFDDIDFEADDTEEVREVKQQKQDLK